MTHNNTGTVISVWSVRSLRNEELTKQLEHLYRIVTLLSEIHLKPHERLYIYVL
jgi:hypothetical protein